MCLNVKMSAIEIHDSVIQKLTHESAEIRLRTLHQIHTKISRAQTHKETICYKPDEMCKQLIRWFGFKPVQAPLKVLEILNQIMQDSTKASKIIQRVGTERFKKELGKVQCVLEGHSNQNELIDKIKDLITLIDEIHSAQESEKNDQEENIIDVEQSITNGNGTSNTNDVICIEDLTNDYFEAPWSRSLDADFTSMKFIADILINPSATKFELQNALLHLQITIHDYPVAHLLQAPHIFRNLLYRFDEKQSNTKPYIMNYVTDVFNDFLCILQKELKIKRKTLAVSVPYYLLSSPVRLTSATATSSSSTTSSISSDSTETIDPTKAKQMLTQLRIDKALSLLFNSCLMHIDLHINHGQVVPHIWNVIYMIINLYKFNKWHMESKYINKIGGMIQKLHFKINHDANENCCRLRMLQIHLLFLLADLFELCIVEELLKQMKTYHCIITDLVFTTLFPRHFQKMCDYVFKEDKAIMESLNTLNFYENVFRQTIKLLIKKPHSDAQKEEILQKSSDIHVEVLEKFQSKPLIDLLFNTIIDCIPFYPANEELCKSASDLLLKLLSIKFMPLKLCVFEKFTSAFKQHIGCLMNKECVSLKCDNCDLLKANIIGVPLSQEILLHIVHEMIETKDDAIKDNCISLLTLFLKSNILFGTYWPHLLNLLMPVMPLLMCCTFSDQLMKVLLKLHHPDSAQMPNVTLLQGNIAFLFHMDCVKRNEAMTRLFYMLSNAVYANEYLPNIMEISDTVPNDLCMIETPMTCTNIFSDSSAIGCGIKRTLNNLLHMLDSPDVEPLIRKTTLMQINVLCNNWAITAELCQAGAYFLVMRVLDNALLKSSCHNYPDAVIPAVSILAKVLLYDATLRCELAECPNMYHLLLRSLIMYLHDIQMRQDATLCLFLLIFAHHLVVTEKYVEAPYVLGYLQIPLQLKFRPFRPQSETKVQYDKVKLLFPSELEENSFWRLSCTRAYAGEHFENASRRIMTSQMKININEAFKLTLPDIKWIRCSQPDLNVQRILRSATNATTHTSLIQALELLKEQLFIKLFNDQDNFDQESSDILQRLLIKYIQMPPGSEDDLKLFEDVIDVAYLSVKVNFSNVISAFANTLQKDPQNTLFMLILKKDDVPLNVLIKSTKFLRECLMKFKDVSITSDDKTKFSDFFTNLFVLILKRARYFYDKRNLQNVRCLLSVLEILSECPLDKPDEDLFTYCKQLMKLMMVLRTSTRTGAQWHKACLLAILRLTKQMAECRRIFRFSGQSLRFLSGLCGHHDCEIRILAWSILLRICDTIAVRPPTKLITSSSEEFPEVNSDTNTEISEDKSGCELLTSELTYLPGGFLNCCLATAFDKNEIICVRQLAGHVFAIMITRTLSTERINRLLKQHKFFNTASEILDPSITILSKDLPPYFAVSAQGISNCELLSSIVHICHSIATQSASFLHELSNQPFMSALYEVLKRPAPESCNRAFLTLISDICRLYTLYYSGNFELLQNTVCRDAIWLKRYCEFIFIQYDCNFLKEINFLVNTLQFLMVLSKDCTAFKYICENLSKNPVGFVKLFKQAFSTGQLGSTLQRCALSTLSLLLIKSQPELDGEEKRATLLLVLESSMPNSSETTSLCSDKYHKAKDVNGEELTVAQCITISLIGLYTHIYPLKACKFATPPTDLQQQVSETLSLLLKVSTSAQEAAYNLKLPEKLLEIFKNFFDEFSGTTCTTFVRRYGESKKNAVIFNLLVLLKFLIYWHSSQMMILKDDALAAALTKVIIQIWPWQVHSPEMKLSILRLCAFLSERSLVVCKQFSTLNSAVYANSVMQLVAKCVMNETSKVKAIHTDCLPVIETGLRVLMNCCSCIEGRVGLQKLHILDIFDIILTFKPRTSRPRPELQYVWLRFWELYSRYEEGAQACHLSALCYVVSKFVPQCDIRLLVLRILLNMSFQNHNRSALITSTDLIYIIDEIVSIPVKESGGIMHSYEEQLLMCVILWKLISGGIKFVAIIRGTKLAKHLRMLHENLKNIMNELDGKEIPSEMSYANDLLKVLDIICKLFEKS